MSNVYVGRSARRGRRGTSMLASWKHAVNSHKRKRRRQPPWLNFPAGIARPKSSSNSRPRCRATIDQFEGQFEESTRQRRSLDRASGRGRRLDPSDRNPVAVDGAGAGCTQRRTASGRARPPRPWLELDQGGLAREPALSAKTSPGFWLSLSPAVHSPPPTRPVCCAAMSWPTACAVKPTAWRERPNRWPSSNDTGQRGPRFRTRHACSTSAWHNSSAHGTR